MESPRAMLPHKDWRWDPVLARNWSWKKYDQNLIDFDQIMKKYDQNMIRIRIANMIKTLTKILLNMIQCQLTSGPGEKYDYDHDDHGLFLYHHINCICIVHDAIGAGKIMIMMRFLVTTMTLKFFFNIIIAWSQSSLSM